MPPLVVAHVEAGIRPAEVLGQLGLAHRRVGAQRDQDGHPRRAAVERLVDGAEQQWQRAAAGGVRHDDADRLAVQAGAAQPLEHEIPDGRGVQHLIGGSDGVSHA
jgi:hypothetical protein